jgi:hypothetical protein
MEARCRWTWSNWCMILVLVVVIVDMVEWVLKAIQAALFIL